MSGAITGARLTHIILIPSYSHEKRSEPSSLACRYVRTVIAHDWIYAINLEMKWNIQSYVQGSRPTSTRLILFVVLPWVNHVPSGAARTINPTVIMIVKGVRMRVRRFLYHFFFPISVQEWECQRTFSRRVAMEGTDSRDTDYHIKLLVLQAPRT